MHFSLEVLQTLSPPFCQYGKDSFNAFPAPCQSLPQVGAHLLSEFAVGLV